MKKTELIFNIISIPVDALMLFAAGVVSFYSRGEFTGLVGPVAYQLSLGQFLSVINKIILALIVIFSLLGLYNLRGTRKFLQEFSKIVIGESLGLLLVILLFFFNQSIFPSRFIILATWATGIILVIFGRTVLRGIQKMFFNKNIGLHKLVIISGGAHLPVIEQVYKNKSYGYVVTGELEYDDNIFTGLERLFGENRIDEILQANPLLSEAANLKLVQFARNKGLSFSFVPNLFEVQRNAVEMFELKGIPVIALKNTPLDGWGQAAKRLSDVILSGLCLLVTSPLILAIAAAIKIDSKGKIIYSAKRGGKGKDFTFYKFRTMHSHLSVGDDYGGQQAERIRNELWKKNNRGGEQSPFLKIKQDPRVTTVGRFLRKTKMDEIPQFWNVLIGNMSMVGPRAHVLDEVGRYRSRYQRMFSIKPGIFGMSQISQVSLPDLPFEDEISLNTYYIENWSLWLDIKILAKSFCLLFFGPKSREDY